MKPRWGALLTVLLALSLLLSACATQTTTTTTAGSVDAPPETTAPIKIAILAP